MSAQTQLPTRGYDGFSGVAGEVTSQSIPAWKRQTKSPDSAPNVIVILVDDMGFSDIAPFGGEIDTPGMQSLADEGYRFTNYHTAPLCSPSRAALLTGLNPHRAGFAAVAHFDPGYPGYTMRIDDSVPTLAESFRASGYATFMVGKWHLTPEAELHDGGDRSSWPVQRGFDRYFGSMDAFTTLFHPHRLMNDNTPVDTSTLPDDYYLTDGLTDASIQMIDGLRSGNSRKPFFLYFAHQAVHGPVQAKPADIAKYRGVYDSGWQHIRDERHRRQITEGIFPADAPRPDMNPGVLDWDALSDEQRATFARYMEAYAGAVDAIDQSLVRITDYLKQIGEYENTIIAITSDNGGTAEGGDTGTRSYFCRFGWTPGLPSDWEPDVPREDGLIGGPQAFMHYPSGWANASNTPYRMYKGATLGGGVRAPLVVSWPAGLPRDTDDAGLRDQYAYVTDLGQTMLDLAGVTRDASGATPEVDGLPFSEVLRSPAAPPARREQYTECMGNRGYFFDQWKLLTRHRPGTPFDDTEWELYDLESDPAETRNIAAEHPELVADLARRWHEAGWWNTVFPLDDDGSTRVLRPSTELHLSEPVTLRPGMPTLERYRSSRLTQLRSFAVEITATITPTDGGVLVAHGDQGGGYSIEIGGGAERDGEITLAYNAYGRMLHATGALPATEQPGPRQIVVSFDVLPEFRWEIRVEVDGEIIAEIPSVHQLIGMSPFTGISVGIDRGSPVDWERHLTEGSFPFTGEDLTVRYVPGPVAPYNPAVIVDVEREIARQYD